MDLSGIMSDDQIGIVGSLMALAVCGLIMALSFRLGPARQQSSRSTVVTITATRTSSEKPAERKAA
jgi:hypothetical protein